MRTGAEVVCPMPVAVTDGVATRCIGAGSGGWVRLQTRQNHTNNILTRAKRFLKVCSLTFFETPFSDMKTITFEDFKKSATAALYCLATTIDIHVRKGGGSALLNLPSSLRIEDWPAFEDFDLTAIDSLAGLEQAYRYGVYGEISGFVSDDTDEGNLGQLQALIDLVDSSWLIDRNWGDVHDVHGESDQGEAFREVVKLAMARYRLDYERTLTLDQIALLAGINERSVRNALHLSGEAMLLARRDEDGTIVVDKPEALRWLRGRHNFKETVRIGSLGPNPPERLTPDGVMSFVHERLELQFSVEHLGLEPQEQEDYMFDCAANSRGYADGKQIRQLLQQEISTLSNNDIALLAQLALVDRDWLAAQIHSTNTQAVAEEGSSAVIQPAGGLSPFNETEGTLDIKLTEAGIRNGYFDIERRYADRFFPADSFGSRGAGQEGEKVALHHDRPNSPYDTDLRVKSAALVSPRKRFSAYFTAHSAKAGDVIRIKRTGERSYQLVYLGQ